MTRPQKTPSPERVIEKAIYGANIMETPTAESVVQALRRHGYRIVRDKHPDTARLDWLLAPGCGMATGLFGELLDTRLAIDKAIKSERRAKR